MVHFLDDRLMIILEHNLGLLSLFELLLHCSPVEGVIMLCDSYMSGCTGWCVMLFSLAQQVCSNHRQSCISLNNWHTGIYIA